MASFKYFEDGFLVLNTTGTTNGRAVLRLQDISLSTSFEIQEIATFDAALFSKFTEATTFSWSVSCSGAVSDAAVESEFKGSSSGDTKIIGVYNGLQLLELAKTRNANCYLILKLDTNNYQKGYVRIASYEISGSVGSAMTYSLELTGNGALTYATS